MTFRTQPGSLQPSCGLWPLDLFVGNGLSFYQCVPLTIALAAFTFSRRRRCIRVKQESLSTQGRCRCFPAVDSRR